MMPSVLAVAAVAALQMLRAPSAAPVVAVLMLMAPPAAHTPMATVSLSPEQPQVDLEEGVAVRRRGAEEEMHLSVAVVATLFQVLTTLIGEEPESVVGVAAADE